MDREIDEEEDTYGALLDDLQKQNHNYVACLEANRYTFASNHGRPFDVKHIS